MNAFGNAFTLASAYLRDKPLATVLNVLMMGLGTGVILCLMLVLSQAETRMSRDAAGIDLVVGAKGSPMQLILSAVFQLDVPTGNIPEAEAETILASPMVRRAVPLALGDSYRSFRIVGTVPDYGALYHAEPDAGRWFSAPAECVIGAEVATRTSLQIGQSFAGAHGLGDGGGAHDDHPYQVVGILKPTGTVVDRLILTSVDSVRSVHAHGQGPPPSAEVTAYLIQYATPMAAVGFPRRVNAESRLQAASPAMETARLFALAGIGISAMKAFALVMTLCAGLGIFIGLMNVLDERRADLALLRLLGGSRATVFLTILAQGMALGLGGVILGVLFGHAGASWVATQMAGPHSLPLTGWIFLPEEAWVLATAFALACTAALFPAWRAYRHTVPESLCRP